MPELYPEDQKKVDKYLASRVHRVPRQEFRPLRLLGIIFLVLLGLTAVSYMVAVRNGIV